MGESIALITSGLQADRLSLREIAVTRHARSAAHRTKKGQISTKGLTSPFLLKVLKGDTVRLTFGWLTKERTTQT